ncbi:hypothetical protein K3X48_08875 [Aliiroseovarius crassostreae]|uniref:Uncharacterized protein n=1 Tax=Aliiroseovarius crassostreae TaxID=154981 RepID=A0A9Q9HCN5_9RHOB|nr:hypothetical protein [Aliiroseovarius crassostreae]UWP94360.1 hypothetical protein K3X48_08875 [Aliiroseovarius crassostreae]
MKPNKKLFFDVLKQVEIRCHREGFVEHPAYVSAWEPGNQAYEATLIRFGGSDIIDQFNMSFYPSWNSFRFDVKRSFNLFCVKGIEDIPQDAGEWTDRWLYQPFDEYLLMSGRAWNIFSIRNDFRVSKRKPLNVVSETHKVCREFERNSTFLFDALAGDYRGRLVDITHYEIERPK